MRGLAASLAALVASLGACEGSDDAGTSASGGASSSSGGVAGGFASDCDVFCDAMIALGCEDASCAPGCVEAHAMAGVCADELAVHVGCLAEQAKIIESCFKLPAPCEPTHDDWFVCQGNVECKDVGSGACHCEAVVSGALYAESCTQMPEGWDCTCSKEGEVIATCPGQLNSCAFFVGCCAEFVGDI